MYIERFSYQNELLIFNSGMGINAFLWRFYVTYTMMSALIHECHIKENFKRKVTHFIVKTQMEAKMFLYEQIPLSDIACSNV